MNILKTNNAKLKTVLTQSEREVNETYAVMMTSVLDC